MISDLTGQIWAALALDLLIGDPRWRFHPVRLIGGFARGLEAPLLGLVRSPRLAGILAAAAVVSGVAGATWGLLALAGLAAPLLRDLLSIGMLYTTFAAKDLAAHSGAVLEQLEAGDIPAARERVSRMVGRDTAGLDETGIVRAAVESVAENSVDGVLAPLLFAFLGGPVGAMTYKAVNTLDSTFGYRNERYRVFGWASARLDDLVNYLPARLSVATIAVAALFLGERPSHALRIAARDRLRHRSPNSGHPEAAFAGALGIRLGGPISRGGTIDDLPSLGDPLRPLARHQIREANALMFGATLTAALLFTAGRAAATRSGG